jgi:hypothetical protein
VSEEEILVRSFVIPAKRRRLVELLANPKRRGEVTAQLAHFRSLDSRWMVPVPPDQQGVQDIERALKLRGASDACYVISQNASLDKRRLPLRVALEQIVEGEMGTLVSCVPGTLGYFEGETPGERIILARSRF